MKVPERFDTVSKRALCSYSFSFLHKFGLILSLFVRKWLIIVLVDRVRPISHFVRGNNLQETGKMPRKLPRSSLLMFQEALFEPQMKPHLTMYIPMPHLPLTRQSEHWKPFLTEQAVQFRHWASPLCTQFPDRPLHKISEPQNQEIGEFCLVHERRAIDFEAPKSVGLLSTSLC